MASAAKAQLDSLVNSMMQEGMLDDQFQQLQMLQDASNPGFVVEVITLFCEDEERMLNELTQLLEQPAVDFRKIDSHVHQMKGSSASIGANRIKLACVEFRRFCEENNKEGCQHALQLIKNEYYLLHRKFEAIMELEKRIAYESVQQNSM